MSYIGFPYKYNTGPGRYDEFRFNESPKWSMRPRVSSESKFSLIFSFSTNYSKNQSKSE